MPSLTLSGKTPPLLYKHLVFRWGRLKLLTSLVLLLCVGITPIARSQDFTYSGESVDGTEIIITAIDEDMNTRVPERSFGDALGLGDAVSGAAARASVFEVTYSDFTPEAQTAFQRAVDIASNLISSPVTIQVQAEFKVLPANVLGGARAKSVHRLTSPAWSEGFWYPDALADKLLRRDLVPGQPDLYTLFNNNPEIWYFGLDGNTPAGKYDFVTIVLHELVHGIGFSGRGKPTRSDQTQGTIRYLGSPGIYDFFVVEGATTPIGNALHQQKLITKYVDPSAELLIALTGGDLHWVGAQGVANNGGTRPKLYAPNPWNWGSSYSHLDEATYPAGDPNSLMTPYIGSAESIHDPGDIMRGMFADMGWGDFPAAPTVTLTGPTGTQPGSFNVTVTFSESVTGFDAADVTLTPSFTHGTGDPTFSVSGSGTTYTVSVTPAANTAGNVVVSVRKNAATAGTTVVPVPALPQESGTIAFDTRPADTVAPTVVIGGPGRANAPFNVTFDFSEALGTGAGGFTMADISANWETGSTNTAPTIGEPSQTDAAAHLYTATITPAVGATDGAITVTLNAGGVQDTSNNPIAAAGINTITVTYDTTAPTVTVVRPQVYDDEGNLVPQTATAGTPFTVNVTFSEPVTGFETSDITVSNANLTSIGGTAESYLVTITPSSSLSAASIVVTVTPAGVTDLAGNTGTATGSTASITVSFADKIRPTITAVTTATKYVRGPFDVTFDFSEPLLEVEGERNKYELLKEDIVHEYAYQGADAVSPSASVPNDPVVDSTDRSRYTVRIVPAGGKV